MLNTKQWKYKIGTGKTPVILSLGMLILFGGLSIWLHKTDNGAYLFGDILTVIMAVVLITTIYRLLFYKVLIGQDGFYYQTQINNGRYYSYKELRKAWISKGKDHGGHDSTYCNIETPEGRVIRFIIYYPDKTAAAYLVRRAEVKSEKDIAEEDDRRHLYRIDGRTFGVGQLVTTFVLVTILSIIDVPILLQGGIGAVFGAFGVGLSVYILLHALLNHFCFLVMIEEKGFFYQTTPFNGTFFEYQDIDRCWSVQKVYRHRRSATRQYLFYFYFTDKAGKTRRFLYSDDIFHHEVEVLKERIKRK